MLQQIECIGELASLVAMFMIRRELIGKRGALSARDWAILEFISRFGETTVAEYARCFALSTSSAAEIERKLTATGCVEAKASSSNDKRKKPLVITSKGREALKTHYRVLGGWLERSLEGLHKDDLSTIQKLIPHLTKTVNQHVTESVTSTY